jgi:uncharacterized protein (DUF1800 family)
MDERARIARLHRRFGFGLVGGELDAAIGRGLDAEIERLTAPPASPLPDPFAGQDLSYETGANKDRLRTVVDIWLDRMVTSERSMDERIAWFWHGILVSGIAKVKDAESVASQIKLLWTLGLGSLDELLTTITVDNAMLYYLDGRDSVKGKPNENYGRELMELFALGVGNFTEADVKAAAIALTGWTSKRGRAEPAKLVAAKHDDTPQTLLGIPGVHDVDTVVAAVMQQPACATFVAGKLGRASLGPGLDAAVIATLADGFRASRFNIRALVVALIDLHRTDVEGGPIVLGPTPWLVMAQRATGAKLKLGARLDLLRAAGQMPFDPPNVAGWPGGQAWYSSATMVGRLNLATAIAAATPPTSPALAAAKAGDWPTLSRVLGLPADFSPQSVSGLTVSKDAFLRLALALVTPEFVEA